MDALSAGVGVLADAAVWGWLLAGVLLGLAFGALPGLTATAGIAILTPLTFALPFEQSMALLLSLYCAGYFAGSVPAILLNLPGAPGNAATAIDGHALAAEGEADRALVIAALASVVGGAISVLVLAVAAPLLARFALSFTSVEYAVLGLFGLGCVAAVSGGSLARGLAAAVLGLYLSVVGSDPVEGTDRLTFGVPALLSGVPLLPALIAFFALTEIFARVARGAEGEVGTVQRPYAALAGAGALARRAWLMARSSLIGTFVGALPGTGPTIAAWISYGQASRSRGGTPTERRVSGVAAAEAANNAVTGGALVPLLTFGIPGDTVTAVLVGALLIQGVQPGPFFITGQADLFGEILVILLVANLAMATVALAGRRLLPRLLAVPMRLLLPAVVVLCLAGSFAGGGSAFDAAFLVVAGAVGFAGLVLGLPMPPLVLGLVLGPIIERNLRDALTVHAMDWTVFLARPISLGLLILTAGVFAAGLRGAVSGRRRSGA